MSARLRLSMGVSFGMALSTARTWSSVGTTFGVLAAAIVSSARERLKYSQSPTVMRL